MKLPVLKRSTATSQDLPASVSRTQTPAVAPGGPVRMRRTGLRTMAGLLTVALGVLLAWWAWSASTHTQRVLALRDTVYRGQSITAADLKEVSITLDPALKAVRSDSLDAVVGAVAKTDLPAGSLLPDQSWTTTPLLKGTTRLVGLTLTSQQLPAQQLHPGDVVQLVLTSRPGEDPSRSTTTQTMQVTVHALASGATQQGNVTQNAGNTRIDVFVGKKNAAKLARWAASGRVSLVLMQGAS